MGTARRPNTPERKAPKHSTLRIFKRSFAFCFADLGGSGAFGSMDPQLAWLSAKVKGYEARQGYITPKPPPPV